MIKDSSTLLQVDQMKTAFQNRSGFLEAVNDMTFKINKGETVAIVGESGSGKSVSALSILRLLDKKGKITSGTVLYNDIDLKKLSDKEIRKIRGKEIAMIFQDPMSSLDPLYTIGNQIVEAIKVHENLSEKEYNNRAIELLQLVGMPDPVKRMKSFPHELSGGQRQRVVIAIALACRPELLIADEPTTALDVTVQIQIMELLKKLQSEFGTAIILVTHDLGVVAEMADRVIVVYAGQVVEQSDVKSLFSRPEHPYTKALLNSIPRMETDRNIRLQVISGSVPSLTEMPTGCRFSARCLYAMEKCQTTEPPLFDLSDNRASKCWLHDEDISKEMLAGGEVEQMDGGNTKLSSVSIKEKGNVLLEVEKLKMHFPITEGFFSKTVGHVRAVDGISFQVYEGETLGLVGESGCGKSTTGRLITGLLKKTDGAVTFFGHNMNEVNRTTMKKLRQKMQFVFQDPYSSISPRMTVLDIIGEPLEVHGIAKGKEKYERVVELLEIVGLSQMDIGKFPHQFSGGQRQRIGIARALATQPDLLICDEAVSALDVSVQAQILNLLKDLQGKMGLSYLFISHDLNVVKYISDRVAVMYLGEIVEVANSVSLFNKPLHPYSQALISAIPVPDPEQQVERLILKSEIPSPSNPPSGCKFHTRCVHATDLCKQKKPEMKEIIPGHTVACHLY